MCTAQYSPTRSAEAEAHLTVIGAITTWNLGLPRLRNQLPQLLGPTAVQIAGLIDWVKVQRHIRYKKVVLPSQLARLLENE